VNTDELAAIKKTETNQKAKTLTEDDIAFLVEKLGEKDDNLRYTAFLLLQAHSQLTSSVYRYWSVLEAKLESDNSYQRSLGVMLLAENLRWDRENKFGHAIDKYLAFCSDEKFITARQTLQALTKVVAATNIYNKKIADHIAALDISRYKANQQSLLRKDIAALLGKIR
jgi:hypothetical protein